MTNDKVKFYKEAAARFLQLVDSGNIDEAYEKFVDMKGTHHNHFFQAGFPALQKAMRENEVIFPDKKITIINNIGEGDLVAVHAYVELKPDMRMIGVYLFRFENDRIVEFWDCGQAIPADSPNKDGAF
jgi:predicted SnoaL-like aldol condensation-catalyzing enzyme